MKELENDLARSLNLPKIVSDQSNASIWQFEPAI